MKKIKPSFKKQKYLVIRKAISKDLALFGFNYLNIRKQTLETLKQRRLISPFEEMFGTQGDSQVPLTETYCVYGDTFMETLLIKLLPLMEEKTGLSLIPTYSYARLYSYGSILDRHKDRVSCAVSTTLNLGGDPWPIYLSPDENVGIAEENGGEKGITNVSNTKGIKINLKPGDMLVYSGCELEHWREKFEDEECGQVFLHYNESSNSQNIFDGRPHVGFPAKRSS